ncbi:MAG: DUF3300 domain-containing protein [Nitrospinales bacterium]
MKRYRISLFLIIFTAWLSAVAGAQGQVPGDYGGNQPSAFSPDELDNIVGRIALYPDDLVGIVLAASTYPTQVVQAAQYLQDLKRDPILGPSEDWDPSVLGLLNYPEILNMMADDIDWTAALGDAVYSQNRDVMDSIQYFRHRAYSAGNLRSNSRHTVILEGQNILIRSVDPDAVYVPRYDPQIVIYRQPRPPIIYYSNAYPWYFNPIAPFFTGWYLGYGISYNLGWNNYRIFYRRYNYPNYRFYHRHRRRGHHHRQQFRNPRRNQQYRTQPNRGRNSRSGNRNNNVWRSERDSGRRFFNRPGTRSGRGTSRFRNSSPEIRSQDRNNQRRRSDNIERRRDRNNSRGQQGNIDRQRNRNSSQEFRSKDRKNPKRQSREFKRRGGRNPSSNSGAVTNQNRGNKQKSFSNRSRKGRSDRGRSNRGGRSSKRGGKSKRR